VNTSWQAEQHAQGTSYNWGNNLNFAPFNEAAAVAGAPGNGTATGGMPCNPGDIVTFGNDIPTGITETVDLNANQDFQISVGTMIFENTNSSYLIDQGTGGTLTLNGNVYSPSTNTTTAGTSAIVDEGGNHTISAPVALATTTTVAITSGSVFSLSGNISGTGALAVGPLTLPNSEGASNGTGTLVLSGTNSYSGGTSVSAGTLLLDAAASLPQNKALTITGGNVVLVTSITAGSQSANVPTTPPTSSVNISTLSISGSGTLNINNNHIIINYGSGADPIASIASWIADGAYGSGTTVTWTGTGITSSAAASNPNYGIGYADANDPGNPAGLASGQIEIMYTLLGDANLDGKVNGSDFNLMATNFNQAVTAGWDKGDFNYDGKVNGNDFVLLAANFNQFASQSAISSADETALDAFAAANGISLTSVPEPASSGLLLVAGLGVLRRRRRSSRQDD
jgi:autotransporter-associated beta strand protein